MKPKLSILLLFLLVSSIFLSFNSIVSFVYASPTTLFTDGFESGFTPWTGTGGTPTRSSTQVHENNYSMMCDANGDTAYKTFDEQTVIVATFSIWINAYPDSSKSVRICDVLDSSSRICSVYLRKTRGGDNYVRLKRYYPSEVNDDWTGNIGTSTWVNIAIVFNKHSSIGGYWLWIDGTLRCNMTGLDTSGAGNIERFRIGTIWLEYTLTAYFDSVTVSNFRPPSPLDPPSPYTFIGWQASGVSVSDTGWKPCGSYFDEYHINLINESNGTTVRFYVCREAWENEYTTNIKGYAYSDYIEYLVQKCHQYGLRVWLTWQPFFDESTTWSEGGGTQNSFSPWELKQAIIRNNAGKVSLWGINSPTNLGDSWRSWIQEVLGKCPADVTDTMCETTSRVTDAEYEAFTTSTIEAIRATAPDIFIFLYGKGGDLGVFSNSRIGQIEYDNVGYNLHEYYNPSLNYDWCRSFRNGYFATGKQQLYTHLDNRFHGLPNGWIGEFGAYRKTSGNDYYANWDLAVQAFYDYCEERDIGCTQYSFGKVTFPMLDTATHRTLNSAGQKWADNMPTTVAA